jgi:hypothetical protein
MVGLIISMRNAMFVLNTAPPEYNFAGTRIRLLMLRIVGRLPQTAGV